MKKRKRRTGTMTKYRKRRRQEGIKETKSDRKNKSEKRNNKLQVKDTSSQIYFSYNKSRQTVQRV